MTFLWDEAYLTLSEEERKLLDLDTKSADRQQVFRDIFASVRKQSDDCLSKRWVIPGRAGKEIIVRDVCNKILHWIKQFSSVVDVAVQFDPGHSALPWAGVRLLLQVKVRCILDHTC